ncbi:MAG TPA: phage tail tube protein [Bacteroidales bacterium]|nr:phage tail tube protein [Bacteroidales bacterium]
MAITLSTGATIAIAKTYLPALGSAATATTALSNASECVVTATHSLVVGDYVVMASGWGLLDQRVARVKSVSGGTSFVLEGVDTSDTSKYPATTGVGTFRKINTWSTLSQVKGISASGGAQQFADITSISDTVIRQIPTVKDAVNMTVDVFDDPTLTWYADVIAADTARSPYALLMTFPNGSKLVANAYWSVMKVPTMETNQALMTQISLSYAAEPVRYSS